MGRRGKREFVLVLRLLETFSLEEVQSAAPQGRLPAGGALSFDAVKHLVLCRLEGRPPRLDMDLYPYLPRVRVSTTSTRRLYEVPRQGGPHERPLDAAIGTSSEGVEAAHLPPGIRKDGGPVRRRRCGSPRGTCCSLAELELIDRHQRMVQRRIRAARFPAVKSLDTFDFTAIPSVNKSLVMELARCEYIQRRENIIAIGNSGTGKTHIALGLGLAACQRGYVGGLHHGRRIPGPRVDGGPR